VLSAWAGTPLAEIEALVRSKGQQLAFEPMDYGAVLGTPAGTGSLGGALAPTCRGRGDQGRPRARSLLGVSAVSGARDLQVGRPVSRTSPATTLQAAAGSFGTLRQ